MKFISSMTECSLKAARLCRMQMVERLVICSVVELTSLSSQLQESNMGLVKQCITSMYKKNIQRLTKVGCFI